MPVQAVTWSQGERDLWARIRGHCFEVDGQALTFTGRLARDHGWSLGYARGAVEEYRRFCFLVMVSDSQMTPSQEVDEVWHQHLTFSQDYWDLWCGAVLRDPLHHRPTVGGPAEALRFAAQYAATLARYEACFGPPPATYWPGTAARFGSRFRIVDLETAIVIPVPTVLARSARRLVRLLSTAGLLLATATTEPAGAMGANVLDWTAQPFLTLYVALGAAALGAAWIGGQVIRARSHPSASDRDLDAIEIALLSGGTSRAADVLALDLVRTGHIAVQPDGTLQAGLLGAGSPPGYLAPLLDHGSGLKRARLSPLLGPWIDPAWDQLAREGLALSRSEVDRIRGLTACMVAPVAILGLSKIVVGLSRDKPVGFLVMLVIAIAVAAALIARVGRLATVIGDRALSRHEARHARAMRAPLPDEAIMAFALAGATALVGTELAGYAAAMRRGDGGDGGGGCGGGGGGGCGGCGGGD